MTDSGPDDYRAGNDRFEKGLLDEAIACYDRAVAADPINPTYRYNRALALMMTGHNRKALEDLHVALELEPDKADIRFLLGEIRSRTGENVLALANYEEALARDPQRKDAQAAIERLNAESSDDDSIYKPIRVDPRLFSDSPKQLPAEPLRIELPTVAELAHPGNDETIVVAIERMLRALPQDGGERVGIALSRAVLLSALHRREAGACWERAMDLAGRRTELLEPTIRAYYEAGEWDEILRLQSPSAAPPSQEIGRLCAHALQAGGRSTEAAQLLERIAEPTSQTLQVLAGIYLALGERELARKTAVKTVELSHRQVDAVTLASIVDRTWFSSARPLDDLAGLEEVKTQIRERVVLPLLIPELYLAGPLSNKFLMMGPPGCGKTTIARIAAREAHARLKTIHLTSILNLFTGNSEANLTALFMDAKDATREGPVILLVDEVDSIAVRRETMTQAGEHRLVNHFMDELDQMSGFPGLVVLAATNVPFSIDSALLRSGRLGSPLYVGPPRTDARRRLIEHQLRKYPHDGVDLDTLAKDLESYSPADIEQAFATIKYARSARRLSGDTGPLTESEIRAAFREIAPSVRIWFQRVQERIRADPSVEGLITGDLRQDMAEQQAKSTQDKGEKKTQTTMFR